jgi:hypothetical protein
VVGKKTAASPPFCSLPGPGTENSRGLYIRLQDEKWGFDDILLEEPHSAAVRLEI